MNRIKFMIQGVRTQLTSYCTKLDHAQEQITLVNQGIFYVVNTQSKLVVQIHKIIFSAYNIVLQMVIIFLGWFHGFIYKLWFIIVAMISSCIKNLNTHLVKLNLTQQTLYRFSNFQISLLKSGQPKNQKRKKPTPSIKPSPDLQYQYTSQISNSKTNSMPLFNRNQRSSTLQVKIALTNPQQFLLQSEFHHHGIQLRQISKRIHKIDVQIVNQQLKTELINNLTLILQEWQKLSEQEFNKKWFVQQFQNFDLKEPCFIQYYLRLYRGLISIVQKILIQCELVESNSLSLHSQVLSIIKHFQLKEFYTYYFRKLVQIKNLPQQKQMSRKEAQFYMLIIDSLSQIDYKFSNNEIPFNLQKYANQFFLKKVPLIFSHYEDLPLTKKIELLGKLQKIFTPTHLTFGKHVFHLDFIADHISQLQERVSYNNRTFEKDLDLTINMFSIAVNNLVLDKVLIKKLNNLLVVAVKNMTPTFKLQRVRKVMVIYEKIGLIPPQVYKSLVANYLRSLCKHEHTFVAFLRFYLYAQCRDPKLLQQYFIKLEKVVKGSNKSKASMHTFHFLIHYICIKYPPLAQKFSTLQASSLCYSNTQRDKEVLSEIMRTFRKKSQEKTNCSQKNKAFLSPCIEEEQTNLLTNNYKSKLSSLQQRLFKKILQNVLEQLNNNPDSKQFYEAKQNFSFCSFELDFAILKWESPDRKKLISYLDAECVGLQYTYDPFECRSDQQNSRQLCQMSLEEYEKGLQFVRKKKIRQTILKHYGWKFLYVPNKFMDMNLISRTQFEKKLKQALIHKFSS